MENVLILALTIWLLTKVDNVLNVINTVMFVETLPLAVNVLLISS
jgi:hypothetical protein